VWRRGATAFNWNKPARDGMGYRPEENRNAMLLDVLTVVFIIGGLVLVWLNLRAWCRRKVRIAPDERENH